MNGVPEDWRKTAEAHQKLYKQMLQKGKKNLILKALPDLHEEAFEQIDCLDCANCCKNYSPRFKKPDIKRIAKVIGMKEGDMILQYLTMDEDGDYVLRQSPCPFLASDNTCDIYEDRPTDCRRYPYTDEDVLLKRVNITLKNATICPATYYVLEKLRAVISK
ncbi:MAG: YkgJ family cysteine cluster protein [Flavipsychrobacter sp.]